MIRGAAEVGGRVDQSRSHDSEQPKVVGCTTVRVQVVCEHGFRWETAEQEMGRSR